MEGIVGFILIAGIIYLLLSNRMSPFVVLTLLPVAAAVVLGYGVMDVVGFIEDGIKTTMDNGILFIFSVTYFGVLSDTGLFDTLVGILVRRAGSNLYAVIIATTLIATVSCFDGATVTAVLITVPALYPVYKRLHIDTRILLCLTGTCMSVMNLLPWSGPVARAATVLNMDLNVLWHRLIPVQMVGLVVNLILAFLLAVYAKRKMGSMENQKNVIEEDGTEDKENKTENGTFLRPKLLWFNLILTVILIAVLSRGVIPNYIAFLCALAVLLTVNYPQLKVQNKLMGKHASDAVLISATLYASGIMVGVMNGTGMLAAMAGMLVEVVPAALGRFIHVIFGLFALPIGMSIGTDAYFYGIMPLAIELGQAYGVEAVRTASAMLIGRCLTPMICPLVPAVYLALSMTHRELKEHLKFSIPIYWVASVVFLGAGMVMGIV